MRSRKVKWADRIYSLRNKIMHGEAIKDEDYIFEGKQRHMDIGPMFFILSLKKELNRFLRREHYFDRIEWKRPEAKEKDYEGFVYDDRKMYMYFYRAAGKMRAPRPGT